MNINELQKMIKVIWYQGINRVFFGKSNFIFGDGGTVLAVGVWRRLAMSWLVSMRSGLAFRSLLNERRSENVGTKLECGHSWC